MAVYKSVKGVGKTKSSLYNVLEYVGNKKENEENEKVYKTTGINVSDDYKNAFKEMMFTKEIHNKLEGRQYRHHIQSFKPGEVDPETAHKIAVEFAEKNNYKIVPVCSYIVKKFESGKYDYIKA